MYNSCRTGRQLSSGSSHLLLPSCVIRLTSVWSNLVAGLGPPPALPPHGRPTRNNDGGNAGASRIFPHPLSLLGVADPIPAVAPSPSWSNAPQRGQNREAVPMQKAQAQLQGQQQCLVVGTCWGCTGTTTASRYHFSVLCVYTKNRCRYVLNSHGRGHAEQTAHGWLKKTVTCKQAANRVAVLTSSCLTSYTKPREREKQTEELHPCLFHAPQFQLHDVVQKEVSILSPYRFFLLHKIGGFFFLCRKIYASFECLYPQTDVPVSDLPWQHVDLKT